MTSFPVFGRDNHHIVHCRCLVDCCSYQIDWRTCKSRLPCPRRRNCCTKPRQSRDIPDMRSICILYRNTLDNPYLTSKLTVFGANRDFWRHLNIIEIFCTAKIRSMILLRRHLRILKQLKCKQQAKPGQPYLKTVKYPILLRLTMIFPHGSLVKE